MIIQNLHKIFKGKRRENREEKSIIFINKLILSSLFSLFSFLINAQDSIPAKVSSEEKINLDFQEVFFKALSEKAINNYQNAINNLEKANELIPNNKAVLFELSKNYLLLNKTFEALEYGKNALQKDPENIWLLEHLVKVNKHDSNFNDAITLQKKIIKNHPKKKRDLVYLFLQNNNISDAKKTLLELKEERLLDARLGRILEKFNNRKKSVTPKKITATKNIDLVDAYKKNKSFKNLKDLLEKLDLEKSSELEIFSQQGIELFPAQPYVYLMNGKANNLKKDYNKALESLQNGIDFVIDDKKMELNFYLEIANANNGLGNIKEANKYTKKALKLSKQK